VYDLYINKSSTNQGQKPSHIEKKKNEKLVETITRSIKHFQLIKGIMKKRQGSVIKMSVQKTKKKR